jgi:thimet oligopeptidase
MKGIKYDYKPGEITELTKREIERANARINEVLKQPNRDFWNTIEAIEQIDADLDEAYGPASFMSAIHLQKEIRDEAEATDVLLTEHSMDVFTREDIYQAVVEASKTPDLSHLEQRLTEDMLRGFKMAGLFLPEKPRARFKEIQNLSTAKGNEFGNNVANCKDHMLCTAAELAGVPETVLEQFEKDEDGKYIVKPEPSITIAFLENASDSKTRERFMYLMNNRAADKNVDLLGEIIGLKRESAELLGYENYADLATEKRMAKNGKTAHDFLTDIRNRIMPRVKADIALLLEAKKRDDPSATMLNLWDVRYYENQLRKSEFGVDNEKVAEFFPTDTVIQKVCSLYEHILGVRFTEVKGADVWAPEVKLYNIHDAKDGKLIASFYMDLFPRDGKYKHFAAFSLIKGREKDGNYTHPVSALVCNFPKATTGKPSLLTHDHVETFFHEFGHIMHQTLTKVKYGSYSGTAVARDFVEAPSQMLEEWAWDKNVLKELSSHYKTGEPLPDELIDKMIAAKDFNMGYFYSRQLLYGLFDLDAHMSKAPMDLDKHFNKLQVDITTIPVHKGTHFIAQFEHLAGGYNAGYYGYLWAKAIGLDMATRFKKEGMRNQKTGADYRKWILEQGDAYDADVLVEGFLGRKYSTDAFIKSLGI